MKENYRRFLYILLFIYSFVALYFAYCEFGWFPVVANFDRGYCVPVLALVVLVIFCFAKKNLHCSFAALCVILLLFGYYQVVGYKIEKSKERDGYTVNLISFNFSFNTEMSYIIEVDQQSLFLQYRKIIYRSSRFDDAESKFDGVKYSQIISMN